MFTKQPATGAARSVLQQAANAAQPEMAAPAANDAGAVPAVSGASIRLSRPLVTHQGEVNDLVLRQPTVLDYVEIGDIDTVIAREMDQAGQPHAMEVVTNHDNLMKWAAKLTGFDRGVLALLAPADGGKLFREVRLAVKPFSQGNS